MHKPTRTPRGTGNAEWHCPFQHRPPSPCCGGADHGGGPQPLPRQFYRGVTLGDQPRVPQQGSSLCSMAWITPGILGRDQPCDPVAAVGPGRAGRGTKSRGRHPKHRSCLHLAYSTEQTTPTWWTRCQHSREVTLPSGPSGTAPCEATGQGCQRMTWPDLIWSACGSAVLLQQHQLLFSSRTERPPWNSGCSQRRTPRREGRPRLCPAAALGKTDLLTSGESMHFFHYEKDTRDQKGASAPPRLLATSPRQAPGQPNCHCVRYCENGNHFLSSKPEVSIPSLQDVIRKEGEKKNKGRRKRRKKEKIK